MEQQPQYPKWYEFYWKRRKYWIALFLIIAVIALAGIPFLKFNFSFEQFFPSEDEDLTFFKEFTKDFEADDNFILIGFERKPHVFQEEFLSKVDRLTKAAQSLPHTKFATSLPSLNFPRKTPFGPVMLPVLNFRDSMQLQKARKNITNDPRFKGKLISAEGDDILIYIKTKENLDLKESREIRKVLDSLLVQIAPQPYHTLGRAYFQTELVDMQQYEVMKSGLIATLLISLVMFFLFRKPKGIAVSLVSILLGVIVFFGFLAWTGHSLNVMASLYPIIMIIVGTSDVIHIMSKYIDEGYDRQAKQAMFYTIKEIGLATLFTSVTTAIGFLSLSFSRIDSIRMFGYNAAIGVILAYVIVIFFTTSWMSYSTSEELSKRGKLSRWWSSNLTFLYEFTIEKRWGITIASILFLGVLCWGISMISTNYSLTDNLPEGYKVKEDFLYFERNFGGYRPYEYAIETTDGRSVYSYEKMKAIHKLEQYLEQLPAIKRVNAPSESIKAIHMYSNNNRLDAYAFPADSTTYYDEVEILYKMEGLQRQNILIAESGKKARVSATVRDIGADSVKALQANIDQWFSPIAKEADLKFRATGTGIIFDKNSDYVRESLVYGLGLAIVIVSLLMAFLFRSVSILFIAIVPNLVPLLAAGALLGFFGIELEAGIAIIFAVVFGIAVDDTIHFLSKYRIARNKGLAVEAAIKSTILETGKAIILTSIILFSGFMILLFSVHPPTRTVGWLISITLLSAVIADLLLIPLLLRWAKKRK